MIIIKYNKIMEEEEPTRTKVLEVIGTHLITPFFN